jgi:carbamoyltransferase
MIVLGFSGISNGEYYRERFGLRFVGHDSGVALIADGRVLFALEEERLNRRKHTSELPVLAVRAAVQSAGIELADIDLVAYNWHATPLRLLHMFLYHPRRIPPAYWPVLGLTGMRVVRDLMSPRRAVAALEARLGFQFRRHLGVEHHRGHAATAFFTSPFDEAAVLTVDGQGEDESATLGLYEGAKYRHLQSVHSPDSIGILYGMVTDFLGMRAGWDEYKVMAMAALGDATRYAPAFDRLVRFRLNGSYRTHRTAMVFRPGYCQAMLERILHMPPRQPQEELQQQHFDLAAALQRVTERVLFHLLQQLRTLTRTRNLCLAGGVFLNSVANGRVRSSGLFDNVYIPPAPGDHGGALGAALHAWYGATGAPRRDSAFSVYSGVAWTDASLEQALQGCGPRLRVSRPPDPTATAADLLAGGRIIGWFEGRDEYGPRALGHRSILASPTSLEMKDLVNTRIKHREPFRPFGGAVPLERASEFFVLAGDSPFMQFVVPVRPDAAALIPAILHAGACRVQTVSQEDAPRFHALLSRVGARTGVPVLLNTSFNDADEPIVSSPADALRTFQRTDLDALVLGPFLVQRE